MLSSRCWLHAAEIEVGDLINKTALPYMNHGMQFRIEYLIRTIEEYSVDGMVMLATRSCKPFFMGQADILEQVERRTGVPGVILESDMCDSRWHSDAQLDTRIEAFMEVLSSREPRR